MTSIKYERVIKFFGDLPVIKEIDLDIGSGELVVFVGPSGCGKTTLLRLLAGLEEATGGNLYIGKTQVNDVPPKDRNIAMVFQNYALFPHMTVAENIGFGLKVRGVGKVECLQAVTKTAEILGIEMLLDRQPRMLSGGQRQRVAMGRALVRNPDVFLMDEPLSNLDAKLRTQMRVEIRKLQRRLGTTTIYVTHDQVEAMTLADRIAVLNDGKLQQFGTPTALYKSPANKFVAGFLGSPSINFLRAERVGEREVTLPDGQRVSLPVDRAEALSGAQVIEIGIRPEQVEVVGADSVSGHGTVDWPTTVTLSEILGGEALIYAPLGDHDVTVKVASRNGISEGSNIRLSFDLRQAHLFAFDDGRCLSPAPDP